MMFDPRQLQDPLLMALLQQLAQQGAQQGGGVGGAIPAQSNPNIFQNPSGVWENTPPTNPEHQALPFAAPGDWATEQYLQQLAAEQAAQQAEMNARMKLEQERLAHHRALELEGTKQEGSKYKVDVEASTGIQKSLIEATGKILGDEFATPDQKLSQIQQLYSTQPKPPAPKTEVQPVNQPVMKAAGPAQNMNDPATQQAQIKELLLKYNGSLAPTKPSIGMKDPRFATQQGGKDPMVAADIARRILIFGMEQKATPEQIMEELNKRPDVPREIKSLVAYYAKQYGGKI